VQTYLFNIYNAVVRASPEAREGVLDYFTQVCKVNQKRAGMRVRHYSQEHSDFRSTTGLCQRTAS
jgi:ubiquitin conjugation factor E4 B